MGQIDWETTAAIGLGVVIAAGAAILGVWQTTVARKSDDAALSAMAEPAPKQRALPRSADGSPVLRRRNAPANDQAQNLPPGHPPLNLPSPVAPPRLAQPVATARNSAPGLPVAPPSARPVQPMRVLTPKPAPPIPAAPAQSAAP